MFLVVGKVIFSLSNTPFMTAITIKPFMFVMEAVMTTLLSPEIGFWMDMVEVEKTWMSSLGFNRYLRLHLHQLRQTQIVGCLSYDGGGEWMQRQRISHIDVSGVPRNIIVWQYVEVIDVLSTWVSFIGYFWVITRVENVCLMIAVGHCLCHNSLVRNHEALG